MSNRQTLTAIHRPTCPRMSVGYAGVLPIRPVKRDNKDKPQLIEPRCWG